MARQSPDLSKVDRSLWVVDVSPVLSIDLAHVTYDTKSELFYLGSSNVTEFLSTPQKQAFAGFADKYDPTYYFFGLSNERRSEQGLPQTNTGSTSVFSNFLDGVARDLDSQDKDSLLNKILALLKLLAIAALIIAALWLGLQFFKSK